MKVRGWISLVYLLAIGLALAGCSDPQDNVSSPEQPVGIPTDGSLESTGIQADVTPDQKAGDELAPADAKEAPPKPLDLTMPPQPVLDPKPGTNIDSSRGRLLPDLFQQDQPLEDGRSINFKGRVLMREGEEQSLDSLEGGQLIIEKKTR